MKKIIVVMIAVMFCFGNFNNFKECQHTLFLPPSFAW